jgi:hypothetical protein
MRSRFLRGSIKGCGDYYILEEEWREAVHLDFRAMAG